MTDAAEGQTKTISRCRINSLSYQLCAALLLFHYSRPVSPCPGQVRVGGQLSKEAPKHAAGATTLQMSNCHATEEEEEETKNLIADFYFVNI